jgi:Fe-S cluster biogenesis protein NfuA
MPRGVSDFLAFYADALEQLPSSWATDWDSLHRRHRDKGILGTLLSRFLQEDSAAAAAVGGSIAAVVSDDPRFVKINEILDEKVRPALMGDGGYLEIIGLSEHTLSIRYQGACGSCPSSLTGTLMAIEGMLKQEVDPDLEVVAV